MSLEAGRASRGGVIVHLWMQLRSVCLWMTMTLLMPGCGSDRDGVVTFRRVAGFSLRVRVRRVPEHLVGHRQRFFPPGRTGLEERFGCCEAA